MITKYKIFKESLIPNIRIGEETERKDYNNITIDDIDLIENDESTDKLYNFDVIINNELEKGIAFDVQIINNELYHPHINIYKNLRGMNLTLKIYTKFIYEFGLIYSSDGRRANTVEIPKIHDKLSQNPKIYTFETNIKGGKIFLFKDHPNFEYYVNKYKKREAF